MPVQVPTYGGPHVEEQGFTGARLEDSAPAEAFNVGASREGLSRAETELGLTGAKIAEKAWNDANQVAILAADRKMNEAETTIVYDPKQGLLAKRGQDAIGTFPKAMEDFDKAAADTAAGLSNEAQRMSFTHLVNARRYTVERVGQRHVAEQMKQFDDHETNAAVANAQDMAIKNFSDMDVVGAQVDKQRALYTDYAGRQGLPVEWVKEKAGDAVSKTHAGIVHQFLAAQKDQEAQAYFDANKDDIKGTDQVALEHALEEGTLRGASQRASDKIVADADDRGDALEQARQIKDPKLRDMTSERVNHFYDQQKAVEREQQNDLYQKSTLLVDKNPNVAVRDLVDADTWSKMDAQQREALQKRYEDPPNNDKLWLSFIDMKPGQIAALNRADFETKYWANFDRAHRNRAESMWEAAQKGDDKDSKLTATLTFHDRLDSTLKMSGLVPPDTKKGDYNKDQALLYAQFEQAAAREVEHYELSELGGKRKATGEEIQKVIDDMVIKKVFVDKPWYQRDVQKPAATLNEDERGRAYVPLASVPKDNRNEIENLIRSKNRRVSSDKVQRAYAAYLTGDRTRFNAILAE